MLALLVGSDVAHTRARKGFVRLQAREAALVTTSYVLVELYALSARRLGLQAVAEIRSRFSPLLDILWVDRDLHEQALDLLLERGEAHLSLVDATSFLAIRALRIDEVFAYDRRFQKEGFTLVT